MDLLMALEPQARSAGGRAFALLGNHEVMNLIGDTRDVTREIFATFVDPRFRETPPRRVRGLREARRRQNREGRAGSRGLLADPRGLAHHSPARIRRVPRGLRAARQVRRLAPQQAHRHRRRRQHLHARRHLAGDGAGEDRGPQRPRPRRDPPARSLRRSARRSRGSPPAPSA